MTASLRPLRLGTPAGVPAAPSSTVRLATRPSPPPATMTDDVWARTMVGTLRVTLGYDELMRLRLDHRAGFLLSLMDASLDLETLVDLSGMQRGEVIELVRGFYESGVVEFR